jgi:hypothetical protein
MRFLRFWENTIDPIENVQRWAMSDDLHAVGPLAEALASRRRHIRDIAEDALIRLLPRLTKEHAALLDKNQRANLNHALSGRSRSLTLAILHAWEQIGDHEARWYVHNLCIRTKNPEVAAAAQACYLILNERAIKGPDQLLRGSLPPSAPAQGPKEA